MARGTLALRKGFLLEDAERCGLTVSTYSPGDGVTRWRFARSGSPEADSYFGCRALHTALGLGEAEAFLEGVRVGRNP